MTTDDLPEAVRTFVLERLNSVEQLTVLQLLRADPARAWTVEQISAELRSAQPAIQRRLDDLYDAGVLVPPAQGEALHRYAPTSPEIADVVSQVLDAFRSRSHRIIELIYSRPPKGILAFADAFKLKKEKP